MQNRETMLLDISKLRVGKYLNEIHLTRGYKIRTKVKCKWEVRAEGNLFDSTTEAI